MTLFFQCMGVLLNPTNPIRRRNKWALVAHTVALFSCLTISFGVDQNTLSIAYVNNREFHGSFPGPLGYENACMQKTRISVPLVMFSLNQWLADGLLVSLVLN